ncbi:MAG: copper-binding protein [Pseudomonadota bacterium]|nr:copper-binding protein [Pseudomonadota bacterium]
MKQTSRLLAAAALAAIVLAPLSALAQSQTEPGKTETVQAAALTDGEVRKIDKDAGKLTIKHGEIRHLEMPGMTMVFTVKDKALLDNVKVGNKIEFMVIRENGRMVVTQIQPTKGG